MKIKLLLVDDHKIVRDGMRSLLSEGKEISVIGEAENGRQAVALAKELKPDVILMDIAMPDMNGIEAASQIIRENERIKVLILSMHSEKMFVSKAFAAGVSGYLLKDCDIEEILSAIRAVQANQKYISPLIAGTIIEDYRDGLKEQKVSILTEREREVLQLIAEGKTSKKIANLLGISTKTIDVHRQQIMDKLNIHTIAGLTRYAIKEGLIS
ncbi:MAG TPA: response regulator transcription factor [bacterium]|nr:response regulator transcription factor [Myxococcales bacterium]OQA62150.1 MAG: Response regulator UvrY [bacterium ADurb.Bin270]HPW45968.1 response regulator transcription factor [bacterium]HQC50258.1 response regulator transcription factor [bacterium]